MTLRLALPLMAALFGSPSFAGPWLREDGASFLSVGAAYQRHAEHGTGMVEQVLFFEHGLTEHLTLAVEGNWVEGYGGRGLAALRFPVLRGQTVASLSLGAGGTYAFEQVDPFLHANFAIGRGFTLWDRSGWATVEAHLDYAFESGRHGVKLDATVGLAVSERVRVMGQAFLSDRDEQHSLTLSPGIVVSNRTGKGHLHIALEHRTGSRPYDGIRFGIWSDF